MFNSWEAREMNNRTLLTRILAIIALAAFLAVSILSVLPQRPVYAVSVNEAQRQQQEATRKKEEAVTNQKEEIARREEIDAQISEVQSAINGYQSEIDRKNVAIEASEQKINRLTADIQVQNAHYNKRAKRLIKKGNVSYAEILLQSKSIDDMLTRISIVKRVAKYDSDKLDEIESSMTEVKQLKEELLVQKSEVLKLKAVQDEKKAELDGYRQESQAIIDDLQKDIETFQKEYDRAKQLEAQARAEAERARQQSQTKYNLPSTYTGGAFHWPSATTHLVTSPYGYRIHPVTGKSRFHAGIDIGAAYGTAILAANAGVVIVSGYNAGGYGNYVVINHGGGYTTLYAHCSSVNVSVGQQVSRGQVIASCGSTGMSTGPHIHFEVQYNGQTTNPMQYFN